MVFTGTFTRSIDDKQRVAIPKRLRETATGDPSGVLYVAPGTDGSLALYTEEALERLAERLAGASPTQHDVRAFMRLFYSRAERVQLDRQGRIRIPAVLVALTQMEEEQEVVLLGVQDHMELWSPTRWEHYLREKQAHYDEIAEAALTNPSPAR